VQWWLTRAATPGDSRASRATSARSACLTAHLRLARAAGAVLSSQRSPVLRRAATSSSGDEHHGTGDLAPPDTPTARRRQVRQHALHTGPPQPRELVARLAHAPVIAAHCGAAPSHDPEILERGPHSTARCRPAGPWASAAPSTTPSASRLRRCTARPASQAPAIAQPARIRACCCVTARGLILGRLPARRAKSRPCSAVPDHEHRQSPADLFDLVLASSVPRSASVRQKSRSSASSA